METMTITETITRSREIDYFEWSDTIRIGFTLADAAPEPYSDDIGMLSYDGMAYGGGTCDYHLALKDAAVPAMVHAAQYVWNLIDRYGFDVDIINRAARIMSGERVSRVKSGAFDCITWTAHTVQSPIHRGELRNIVLFGDSPELSDADEWLSWADGNVYWATVLKQDNSGGWVELPADYARPVYFDPWSVSDETIRDELFDFVCDTAGTEYA